MTERPNQRHTGVAHGIGLDVGMSVDGDERSGYAVRENGLAKSRLAREARRGIVIVTVTVLEEWPRDGGIDDRSRTHQTKRADSCAQGTGSQGSG